MIIGMTPMALGLGEGGEQNAPLGRAVIGGLIFATFATLMFVPVVFSLVHKKQGAKAAAFGDVTCPLNRARRSRAGAGPIGVAALIGAGLIVVIGIRAREDQRAAAGVDRSAGRSDCRGRAAQRQGRSSRPWICRSPRGLFSRPDFRAHQRLSEELDGRHRRWGQGGQVLAEIEVPDLDQQLLQARADLASAQPSEAVRSTLKRGARRCSPELRPAQEIDERTADLATKKAQVKAAQANVDRLQALAGYKKITCPVRWPRHRPRTDVGALINAGGGTDLPCSWSPTSTSCASMSTCRRTTRPRQVGTKAVLTVPEYPGRTFPATLEASSQAVEAASGTTRMQLAWTMPTAP